MAIIESNKIRGWFAFSGSGLTIGLITGLLLINNINDNWIFEFLALTSILGGLLGIGIGLLLSKDKNMEEYYDPLYHSKDLDSFYRKTFDPNTEKDYVELISQFTNPELIATMTMRYYKLSDKTTDKLIMEFQTRKIQNQEIEEFYNSKKYFSLVSYERCPGCNSKDYLIRKDGKITNCMLCGYNIEFDNPNSAMNRIRWKLGVYSNSKLKLNDLLRLINMNEKKAAAPNNRQNA